MSNTQLQCPPLANEPARLVAVRADDMPDGVPEAEFDATVRLAARLCSAPMAFVVLAQAPAVKACIGVDRSRLEGELVQRALIGIPADGLLVIEDLDCASTGAGNGAPAGAPDLRFYAGAAVLDAAGKPLGAVAVLDVRPRSLDAAQRSALRELAALLGVTLQTRRHAAELARQALLDPLTGVANRKQFEQTLLAELHHSMRSGEPFTLLLLSLDGGVDIRNGFGPAAADAALRKVAQRMARQVRLGDLLARLGGDEFGAVMRHGAADAAEVLATRIVDAVRQPLTLDSGDVVGLRVCIGIAAYSDEVESVAALMGHAGQALQQARREHERRWNFFGRRLEVPALRLVAGEATRADDAMIAPAGEPAR